MHKRKLDICILSDLHIGSYEFHARECLQYLQSIQPQTLILNGDIIDAGVNKINDFSPTQIDLINEVLNMSKEGVKIFYLRGNHDEIFRKFEKSYFGRIHVRDKLILHHNQKSYLIFHGDVFDSSLKLSPFIAKLGGNGYDLLLKVNRFMNQVRKRMGLNYLSISTSIKSKLHRGKKIMEDFENAAIKLAADGDFDYVICGHIHEPKIRDEKIGEKEVTYMNSGDWVGNLTALELSEGDWNLYKFSELDYALPLNPKLILDQRDAESERIMLDEQEMELLAELV